MDKTGWTALESAIYDMARLFEPLGIKAMTFVVENGVVKVTVRDAEIVRYNSAANAKPEVETQ